MKKAASDFAITWIAGGVGNINAVVEYDGKKIKGSGETKNYEEFLRSVVGRIATAVGKTEEFKVETEFQEKPEKMYRYGGEKLTITISGDNPACHKRIKKAIEGVFGAHRFAGDMADLADQFIDTTKDVIHGFVICIARIFDKKE